MTAEAYFVFTSFLDGLSAVHFSKSVFYHLDMDTKEAVANKIRQLCDERGITPNGPSNLAAVPQATIKSILNFESKNAGVVTLKKICDGFEITLGEFFSTPEFDSLEQEII